jgi:hypothetical protein
MDKHVGVFEMGDGRIQHTDYENVTKQCFNRLSKLQFRPFL